MYNDVMFFFNTLLLRLVDCSSLLERSEVYEMIDYDRVIKKDLEKSKNLLNKKYTRIYIHMKLAHVQRDAKENVLESAC